MTQIDAELRKALLEVFRPTEVDRALEKIGVEGSVRDLRNELDFDSLDEIEFVMALEEGFGIEITDSQAQEMLNSGMTISELQEKLNAKRPG